MNEFEEKVLRMRKAQKDYFKNRNATLLMVAKGLEREVDAYLSEKTNPKLGL